jgi:hypothetical protein
MFTNGFISSQKCYNQINEPATIPCPGSRPLHLGGVMMSQNISQKRCPQCGETKDISEFPVNRKSKDGHHSWCKLCCRTKSSEAYDKPQTKQRVLDYQKERYDSLKGLVEFREPRNIHSGYWLNLRRADFFGVSGTYTVQECNDLMADYGGRCAYCGSKEKVGFDHIVPLSRGGSNSIDNMVPCCKECNKSKHATPLLVWMWKMKSKAELLLSNSEAENG